MISIVLIQIFFLDEKKDRPVRRVDLGGAIFLSFGVVDLLLGTQLVGSASLATALLIFAAA